MSQKTKKANKKPHKRVIQNAMAEAWEREAQRVANGYGIRQWTANEQEELLSTGKVRGYSVHHMKNAHNHPEWADKIENFQFLRNPHYEILQNGATEKNPDNEHAHAHQANPDGSTNGFYNHETGITHSFGEGSAAIKPFIVPLREFYLKDRAVETHMGIAQLRSKFYNLRKDITEQDKALIKKKGIDYVLDINPHSPVVIEKVRNLLAKNTKRAWKAEILLIASKGQCSRPWTNEQLHKLFIFKRVDGFEPRSIEGNFSTLESVDIGNVVFAPYGSESQTYTNGSESQTYTKGRFTLADGFFENIAEGKGISKEQAIFNLTGYKQPQEMQAKPELARDIVPASKSKQIDSCTKKRAKEIEIKLVKRGQGTSLWTEEQQERWLLGGKGFGTYLIYPELGSQIENIVFSDAPVTPRPAPAGGKLPKRTTHDLNPRFIDSHTYKEHFKKDATIERYLREKEKTKKKAAEVQKQKDMAQRPSIKPSVEKSKKKKNKSDKKKQHTSLEIREL
jgi:hypothetical protein